MRENEKNGDVGREVFSLCRSMNELSDSNLIFTIVTGAVSTTGSWGVDVETLQSFSGVGVWPTQLFHIFAAHQG